MPDAVFAPGLAQLRQPRGLVKVGGKVTSGWIDWEVDTNTFYQADTFRVTFVLSSLPVERNAAWWAGQTEVFVEVFGGLPADPVNYSDADLTSWIYGRADHIEIDPVAGTLTVTGRDLTSYFIDTKTTEEWRNQTASQIAATLAARHALTPVVTSTSKKVGGYYEIDHVLVTNQHSEWDLLSYVASKEEFVVYVKGRELHFEPRPDPTSSVPYVLQWTPPTTADAVERLNGKTLSFSRDLTVAKGVVVWVQAKNVKTKKWFSVAYPANQAKGTKPGQASPHSQVYTFRMKGDQTPDAALRYAQEQHRNISQHEVKMHATMPADDVLTPRNVVQVRGTGTTFDQTYYPDNVMRRMGVSGYEMEVSAKNIAKQNEGVL